MRGLLKPEERFPVQLASAFCAQSPSATDVGETCRGVPVQAIAGVHRLLQARR